MDTVIWIGNERVRPYFAVKSQKWISKKDILNLLETKKKNNGLISYELLNEKNVHYGVHQIYEFGKLLYFEVYEGRNNLSVFYDTETNKAKIFTGFVIDDLVFEKDVLSLFPRFSFTDNNGVYIYFADGMLRSFYDIAQSGGLHPNLDKRDELMKLEIDANPVIFYHEFKSK
jgi:hypothetical protein